MNRDALGLGEREKPADGGNQFGVLGTDGEGTVFDEEAIREEPTVFLPEVADAGEEEEGFVDSHVIGGDAVGGCVCGHGLMES